MISEFANQKREEMGNPPIRKMAEAMGISYSRFRDILNQSNGTPTLDEFVLICEYFNVKPSTTIELLLQQIEDFEAPTPLSMEQPTPAPSNREDHGLVADSDPNKNIEMNDYYD